MVLVINFHLKKFKGDYIFELKYVAKRTIAAP